MRLGAAIVRGVVAFSTCALLVALAPKWSASSSTIELVTNVPTGTQSVMPLELARRLREAILDRATLGRLAAELAPGASEPERIDAAARVERGVEMLTVDGQTFHLIVRDRDAERATRTSNELASLAVARAPGVVAKACPAPGCSGTARLAAPAALIALPLEPERFLALGFGVLFALAVAVVPLAVVRPKSVVQDLLDRAEEGPTTERLPAQSHGLATTLPVASSGGAAARAQRAPANADALADRRPPVEAPRSRSEPPARSDPPGRSEPPVRTEPPPPSEPNEVSPIMGYPATPGWRPDPSLSSSARATLAVELRGLARDQCLMLAVSASPQRSQLKASVATEVALAISETQDCRLLVVDADFSNPEIAPLLHLTVPTAADFPRELGRRASGAPSSALNVLICTDRLHVLPALRSPSAELLLTTDFEGCLTMLRDFYDIVVVNAPLTTAGVYCTAVADVVDGVIVVAEDGASIPEPFKKRSFLKILTS